MSKRQWDNFGTTWDNIGQQPLETTMLNYKSERDKKTNTGNSALGKLSTLRGYIYISHSDEVYRRCCTWGFVSCAVRQVIMSRRLRPYYAGSPSMPIGVRLTLVMKWLVNNQVLASRVISSTTRQVSFPTLRSSLSLTRTRGSTLVLTFDIALNNAWHSSSIV